MIIMRYLRFQLCFHGADSILRMDISSGLASEEVAPEIKLKSCVQNYRPTEAKVIISARDILGIKTFEDMPRIRNMIFSLSF